MEGKTAPRPSRIAKTLDRVLSRAGFASRSEARAWIASRRVEVNGRICVDPDRWIDPHRDRVRLDGKPLEPSKKVYLLLYKPKGYLTTARDPAGRRTVYDLLPSGTPYVFPAGRLDLDTSGLLVMTNDSRLADALTSPEHEIAKTYLVKASTLLPDDRLRSLAEGIALPDGPTRPAVVTRLREAGGKTVFEITLTEGRNRQVRRMVEAVGSKVLKLVRTRIGPIGIGKLPIGTCRELTEQEVRSLMQPGRGNGARSSRSAGSKARARSRRKKRSGPAPRGRR